jgi:hypothetical protein
MIQVLTDIFIEWVFFKVTEMFPTTVRSTAMGTCNLWSRIGAMLAPLITNLDKASGNSLPLMIFGISGVAAGILAFFLPETAGHNLPGTIEEAEKADNSVRICFRKK